MIEAVFFDIGNVLVYFSYERMFKQVHDLTGIEFNLLKNELLQTGIKYESGHMSSEELYHHIRSLATKKFSEEDLFLAISDIFTENLSINPIVQSIKQQGIPLYLISNTCPEHYKLLLRKFSVFKEIDLHILSYEVGARKPDQAIFKAALALAGCPPQNCFYTDDIPEYVESARLMGIDAEVYLDSPTLLQELKKRNISLNIFT